MWTPDPRRIKSVPQEKEIKRNQEHGKYVFTAVYTRWMCLPGLKDETTV